MYDKDAAIKAQKEYCEKKGYPHFAPHNGICYFCGQQIYEAIQHDDDWKDDTYTTGITVKEAASVLVTGCPHCHRSYCD